MRGDGTTALYTADAGDAPETFGFDQSGLLWLSAGGYGPGAVAFDPVAGAVTRTLEAESQSPRSALQWSGGVWRTWSDSTTNTTYASLLK
ncbi:hypothetical protein [Deinococcus koreensis]|uniref:Uncharacterized protein n=1 Tax=Deinococcus koreensis TaxID=2054903 RepID=A0A2K3V1N6_9DEIO|nr:hypothetical protein [Deinococcus koreensis]PNY82688.1 hypothetical protein CVO96_16205 [Deinococcus koreensis]